MEEAEEFDDDRGIEFCTMGMFIVDEIHFLPPRPPVYNIMGGAGSYSALGARLFSPFPKSKDVGWVVDAGSDFPVEIRTRIESWRTGCLLRNNPERLTTRGWNGYGEGEKRSFRYTTPKLRLDENSLSNHLLWSKGFHLICSPSRCIDLVRAIQKKQQAQTNRDVPPQSLHVWEPVPDLCTVDELENCHEALKSIDVVSPNHSELGGFFGCEATLADGRVDRESVQQWCSSWLERGIGENGEGAIVVRAGKEGCYVASRKSSRWIPAFHSSELFDGAPSKVVDPTGGGNAFLGGLAIGLVRGQRTAREMRFEALVEAAIWGSIAASFAIEQIGLPSLQDAEGYEKWNGALVEARLAEFKDKLQAYIQPI